MCRNGTRAVLRGGGAGDSTSLPDSTEKRGVRNGAGDLAGRYACTRVFLAGSLPLFLHIRSAGGHDRARFTGRLRWKPVFFPEVARCVVQIARERPQELGRSWSSWDGTAISRQWVRDGAVSRIAAEAVRRILLSHRLKP
jgi:hypothetical protein